MGKIADATFKGASGTKYDFEVYALDDSSLPSKGGVYMFTKRKMRESKGSHIILYIGESWNVAERVANHDKLPCVNRHEGSCICIHFDGNAKSRHQKESDLLKTGRPPWPPCNFQDM